VTAEKIYLNGEPCKASKDVKPNDEVSMRMGPVWKKYLILDIPKSRVGAKLVSELIKETTAWDDLETLDRIETQNKQNRLQGLVGRPTKKVRRTIDRYREEGEQSDEDYSVE